MNKWFLIILSFSLLSCSSSGINLKKGKGVDDGLNDLSYQIVESMLAGKKRKIAIIPFSDLDGNVSDFGKFLSDELIDQFFITKKFGVVERNLLIKVMEEHKLTLSNLFEPNSAKKLGALLGADAIASGTYTVLGKSVRIRARIIDVETAEVFAVAKTEIVLDENIIKLLGLKKEAQSRWSNESEAVKKREYDKHMKKALDYVNEASNMKPFFRDELRKRGALYKAALVEIEIALSIYPNDIRAIKMKKQIEGILK